jgi:hypothetical protein
MPKPTYHNARFVAVGDFSNSFAWLLAHRHLFRWRIERVFRVATRHSPRIPYAGCGFGCLRIECAHPVE